MIFYFLLLGYTLLLLICYNLTRNRLFLNLVFLGLIIFSGIRYNVGVDYMSYREMFLAIKEGVAPFTFEPANMLIIKVINLLDIDCQVIFFVYSTITMFCVYYFINKLSPIKEISIIIFFMSGIYYLSTFNGIRQWVAIGISAVALVKLIESKYSQFIFLIILSSLFHLSAIVLLVLLFCRYRYKKIHLFITLSILLIMSKLFMHLIIISKYSIYINLIRFDNKGNPLLLLLYITIMIYILFYMGYFSKKVFLSNTEVVLINMNILSIFEIIIAYILNIDFLTTMRLNMYFQIQLIILLPMMLLKIKNTLSRAILIYSGFCFLFFYYFYILYFKGEIYNLVPYKTIISI